MFTGQEEHDLTLADAKKLTKAFRDKAGAGAILGHFFSKKALQKVLDQEDCVGIRHYYGEDKDGDPVLVLVGVTADGSDMTGGVILEIGFPCPPKCLGSSPLAND
jgi:hypothetical protein